jgi:regulator of protease activity HflC (stomatin/prohibitin superfamily)
MEISIMAAKINQIRVISLLLLTLMGYLVYNLIPTIPEPLRILILISTIILTIATIFFIAISFLYVSAHPTDLAIKIRMKKFTGKVLQGGMCFWLPILEDFIIFDSRIHTLWIGFLGARGHNKTQIKEFNHFKEKFLIVDRKKFFTQNEQEFNSADFYTFGPLFSSNREEVDLLCAVNYRIVDALKLAQTLNIVQDTEEEKSKFKPSLIAKLASALKETVARMTLDEIFEERQKLMELLVRNLLDMKDDWGLEVLNVAIEEMWLEDDKLQEMLDEKKKAEIIADSKQIMEKHDAETKIIIAKAEQDRETIIAKARDEGNYIQEQTRQEVAKLRRELMEIRAEADKIMVSTQTKARMIIANAEAQRLMTLNHVIEEKIIQHELINTIPVIMDQISLANEKFVIIPSSKYPMFPGAFMGGFRGGNQDEEKEE